MKGGAYFLSLNGAPCYGGRYQGAFRSRSLEYSIPIVELLMTRLGMLKN